MHEMSIMQSLFKILVEKAKAAKAQRIRAVTLRIGRLSGIEADLLSTAFQVISKETMAEGAELKIVTSPFQSKCKQCNALFKSSDRLLFECPECGSKDVQVEPDDDLMVENMEVEVASSDL